VVLPLDSHFSMENVSYTKSGLLSTNISRGDILEYNLLGVYNNLQIGIIQLKTILSLII
jgi:hypothetical protein